MEEYNIKLSEKDLKGVYENPTFIQRVFKQMEEGKRFGTLLSPSKLIHDYLNKNSQLDSVPYASVEMREMHENIPNAREVIEQGLYAIGVPKSLENVITIDRIDSLNIDSETKEKTFELFRKVSHEKIAEAIVLICSEERLASSGMENPEQAVLLGLIFGFEKCCIEYYIETRYKEQPRHSYEGKIDKYVSPDNYPQHVLCEHHAKDMLGEIPSLMKKINQIRNVAEEIRFNLKQ